MSVIRFESPDEFAEFLASTEEFLTKETILRQLEIPGHAGRMTIESIKDTKDAPQDGSGVKE